MTRLPVERAHRLAEHAEEHRWLVTGLWSEQAVGIVGGEPKCCKSFLALDLVVAVASGTPCLRRFTVPKPGRVLLYAAEDALHIVRRRLDGIALAAGVALADLDILVITVPTLRLDLQADRERLEETVAKLTPRLLVLDPFVRLHRIDENASGEVGPLLAYLRELQRRYGVAVLVVHHARKGAASARAGQALRGSSEFHAWGDSNLYLRRDGEGGGLLLTVEHRAAPSLGPLAVELVQQGQEIALAMVIPDVRVGNDGPEARAGNDRPEAEDDRPEPPTPPQTSLDERIAMALSETNGWVPFAELRSRCRVRAATLYQRLTILVATSRVKKGPGGYRLPDGTHHLGD